VVGRGKGETVGVGREGGRVRKTGSNQTRPRKKKKTRGASGGRSWGGGGRKKRKEKGERFIGKKGGG